MGANGCYLGQKGRQAPLRRETGGTIRPDGQVCHTVAVPDANDSLLDAQPPQVQGAFQSLLATAIGLGATVVRVGFEDSIFYASAKAARTNSELVEKITSLIYSIGYEVAAPDEARELLGLN